jgi:hypothetical protein
MSAADEWICKGCTIVNQPSRTVCKTCNTPRLRIVASENKSSNDKLHLVRFKNLGNCEEGHYDFLYIPCLLDANQLAALIDDLTTASFAQGYFCADFSDSGHGCTLDLAYAEILNHMVVKPIAPSEAQVLLKFELVSTGDKCEWYREFRDRIMDD